MPGLIHINVSFSNTWLVNSGPPIMMLALFLTAFPPVFGYSSLITMSGKLPCRCLNHIHFLDSSCSFIGSKAMHDSNLHKKNKTRFHSNTFSLLACLHIFLTNNLSSHTGQPLALIFLIFFLYCSLARDKNIHTYLVPIFPPPPPSCRYECGSY